MHSFHSVPISLYLGSLWFASLLLGRAVLSLRITSWLHRIGQSVNPSPDPRLLLDEPLYGVVRKAGQKKPCEIKTFPTSGIPVGQTLLSGWGPMALSATTPIRTKILRLSHARGPALCKDVGSALTHRAEVICILWVTYTTSCWHICDVIETQSLKGEGGEM